MHQFRRVTLTSEFLSEGASFGDFDRDGEKDVVAGPYWYPGPDFRVRHAIYPAPAQAFDPRAYSNNFFAFVTDFDRDGWDDVLFVDFPGRGATWYQNTRELGSLWTAHRAFDVVDNEAPAFTDLTGDGLPELVFSYGGQLGYAAPNWSAPADAWTFHAVTAPRSAFSTFNHGLGVGDVNGDGRADVIERGGFWEQPASVVEGAEWTLHEHAFSAGEGGAQMFAYDVDADGDADVVTSLRAHGSGLAWFEQRAEAGVPRFVEHVIVPAEPSVGGVILHEPHALALADLDADGDHDIVTGERFWGHVPEGDPRLDDPARLYWFELIRSASGVRYVAHLMDDASGVGTQVVLGDVTGDGLLDVVTANKKGAFLLVHE